MMQLPTSIKQIPDFLRQNTLTPALLEALHATPQQRDKEAAIAIMTLAEIGTVEALATLRSYRPDINAFGETQHRGNFGTTYSNHTARALCHAWQKFDGDAFVNTLWRDVDALNLENAPALRDLTGIGQANALERLQCQLASGCDTAPLASCPRLASLSINLAGRRAVLRGLDALPHLNTLQLINSTALSQAAVDTVMRLPVLERLEISLGATIDPQSLLQLPPSLRWLKFAMACEDTDASPTIDALTATMDALLARGVKLILYVHEPWTRAVVDALPSVAHVELAGFHGLARTHDDSMESLLYLGGLLTLAV